MPANIFNDNSFRGCSQVMLTEEAVSRVLQSHKALTSHELILVISVLKDACTDEKTTTYLDMLHAKLFNSMYSN